MSKVLITGAGGFIGFHLTKSLIEEGHDIVCIDNFYRIPKDNDIQNLQNHEKVKWIEASIQDLDLDFILKDNFDYIYHLATINGTDNFYEKPFTVLDSVVVPTLNILNALINNQKNLKRFFLASTSEVYASMTELHLSTIPTSENTIVGIDDIKNSRWSYASGKICAESAVIGAGKQFGIPWTIGRYHNVYGPRMGDKHFIPDFINRSKRNEFMIYGPNQSRCFTFYKDAIDQTVSLARVAGSLNQIVNIGTDIEHKVKDVAALILKKMGLEDKVVSEFPSKSGSVNRRVPDLNENISLIGLRKHTSLEDGIEETVSWYLSHPY